MKTLNKDAQRKPIGGHHFTDRGQIIRGDTFREVVQGVEDFRLANGYPLGHPEQEVLAYYEAIAPWLVVESAGEGLLPSIPKHLEPLRDWLNGVWKAGNVVLASKIDVKERCVGCEGCKYATEIDWDCSVETEELRKRAELIKGMRPTPLDESYCRLHKWHNGVAVSLLKPRVNAAAKERSPGKCFVHSL